MNYIYQKSRSVSSKQTTKIRRRFSALLAVTIFILSTIVSALVPFVPTASAAGALDGAPLETKALSYTYLNALRWCVTNSSGNLKDDDLWGGGIGTRITDANAKAGKWFVDHSAWDLWRFEPHRAAASYLDPSVNDSDTDIGKTMCNSILNAAYKMWGYSSPIEFLCSFVSTRQDGSPCEVEGSDFGEINKLADALYASVKNKVYGGEDPTLYMDKYKAQGGYPAMYLYYQKAFFDGCNAKESSSATGNFKYDGIRIISANGESSTKSYGALDYNTKRFVYTERDGAKQIEKTCKEIADAINTYADAYKAYRTEHKDELGAATGGGTNCDTNPDSVGCTDDPSSCVIDGVGWIVCAGAVFMANVGDELYNLIELMISVPPINVDTTSGSNGVYNAWSIMRTFANVAFVIVFLVIIFSQLTGMGVSNYGVKKTLPRLIIAAILVNLSFWISAIAVDLSNIAGKGIFDILSGIKNTMNIGGISSNWGSIITALLAGQGIALATGTAAVGGGVALGAIVATQGGGMALAFLAIPLVLAAVLAILILVFILVARQAMIIILILISPLAFVAMLLPNTEKLFVKWRQTLVSLLLMYPIVSLIFGGAQIAGLAILSSAGGTDVEPLIGGLSIITGQLVIVAPFFFLPVILKKFSGGNLESMAANITSKANHALKGINQASRAAGNRRMGRTWNRMKYGTNNSTRGGRAGTFFRGAALAAGKVGVKYDQVQDRNALADDFLKKEHAETTQDRLATDSAYALKITGGDQAKAAKLQARAIAANRAEDLKTASSTLTDELAQVKSGTHPTHVGTNTDDFLQARAQSVAHTEIEREAAMNEAARQGRDKVVRALGSNPAVDQQALQRAIAANGASLVGKAPDLVKPAASAFGAAKGDELANYSASTAQKHIEYIEQLHAAAMLPGATAADQAALNNAVQSFNSAVIDISKNPTLQAKFGGEVGREYAARIAALDPALQGMLGAAAGIQSDGKIR